MIAGDPNKMAVGWRNVLWRKQGLTKMLHHATDHIISKKENIAMDFLVLLVASILSLWSCHLQQRRNIGLVQSQSNIFSWTNREESVSKLQRLLIIIISTIQWLLPDRSEMFDWLETKQAYIVTVWCIIIILFMQYWVPDSR